MHVLLTDTDDGAAEITISVGGDDHRFDVWAEDETGLVEYQETLTWRGVVEVSEPDEDVFKALMSSDEMTNFLERHGCSGVQRAAPQS